MVAPRVSYQFRAPSQLARGEELLKDPNLLYHLLVDVLHALLQAESLETEQAEAQADLLEGSTSEKDRRPDGNKSQQRLDRKSHV